MDIRITIWNEFLNTYYGSEYLVFYLSRQKTVRKWFKILTILFSVSGIFNATFSKTIPTIISCTAIGIVQILTSIENFIIHSDSDIEKLSELRMLYWDKSKELEKMFYLMQANKINSDEAANKYFALKDVSKKIEELDTKLNVRTYKKLKLKAEAKYKTYLKNIFNV